MSDALTRPARLAALEQSGLLDSPVEDSFERATRLAAQLVGVPVSLVSIVAPDRQFFKSALGLAEPWAKRRETPLSHSFCQYVVADDAPLVITDARRHSRVAASPAIDDLKVVAYLGVPFRDAEGEALGSLCAIDAQPREWSTEDIAALEDIAEFLRTELRFRAASSELVDIAQGEHVARLQRERADDLRFTRLAESATDGIFVLRYAPDPVVIFLNPALEELTGHPRKTLSEDASLFADLLSAHEHADLLGSLGDGQGTTGDVQCRHRDGSSRWVSVSTTVMTDDEGAVSLVQGVVRDIDERKRTRLALEASLEQERAAAKQAARLNEMTSTFLTAISHELRTPLTSVIGFAELLASRRDRLSSEQQSQMVDRIRTNAHRLQLLLEDVLDVDRLSRGQLAPQRRLVRLDALVEGVLDQIDADRSRVTVLPQPFEVLCDVAHLERIVANLIGNALRHTPPGTPVIVSADRADAAVVLTVDDHGDGIPDNLKAEIFEPFIHGPQAATAASPGTGLGLTLARDLAELNNGTVAVADRPGGGARSTVTLPTG